LFIDIATAATVASRTISTTFRAREGEELMKQLSQPKLADVLPSAEEGGDDPATDRPNAPL
jgi:hypothetical protein